MLSKKDREDIRALFAEEFNKAMTWKFKYEKGPRKQGDPEKLEVEEEWNIFAWLAQYIPYLEGAMRGMQADTNKMTNAATKALEGIKAMSELFTENEKGFKALGEFNNVLLKLSKSPHFSETLALTYGMEGSETLDVKGEEVESNP